MLQVFRQQFIFLLGSVDQFLQIFCGIDEICIALIQHLLIKDLQNSISFINVKYTFLFRLSFRFWNWIMIQNIPHISEISSQ